MVFLALGWQVWLILLAAFLIALGRRVWRQWRADRRRR